MRTRAGLFALLIAAGASADALAQKPAATSVDPVGVYEIVFEMAEGQMQMSELNLTRTKDGKLSGTMGIHGEVMNIEEIVWADRKLNFNVNVPHGRISVAVVFDGTSKFNGTYSVDAMGTGKISGTRKILGDR